MSEQQGQEKQKEFVPDVAIDPQTGRETEQHRDKMETQKDGRDTADKGDKGTERQ